MKNLLGIIGLSMVVALSGCQPPPETGDAAGKRPAEQKTAREPAPVEEGTRVDLSVFRGEPLLVYFWAPWTDSGDAAAKELAQLTASSFKTLPVIVDRQAPEKRAPIQLQTESPVAPVWAHDDLIRQVGGIRALPTAVLLDENGKVINTWPGLTPAQIILAGAAAPGTAAPPVPSK